MEDAGARRSRMTLLDQLSVMEPKNLRDLLSVRDEVDDTGLGAVAGRERTRAVTLASILEAEKHGGRTLLDIIREEDEAHRSTPEAGGSGHSPPDVEVGPDYRVSLVTLLALADRTEESQDMVVAPTSGSGEGIALLTMAKMEGEEAATVAITVSDERIMCCVCMVRKKGAAFIPCGHTFCRACSRELWTGRGSCPLCNGVIFDVLDIF